MIPNRFWFAWAVALAAGSLAASCGGSGGSDLFEGEGGSGDDAAAGSSPDAASGGSAGKGGASGHGGSPGTGGTPASGGASGIGGSGGATSTGGSSGAGGSTCPGSCDDGVPCTLDSCEQGSCVHTPYSGNCAPNQECDPKEGCILSLACSTNDQCTQKFGNDPCKANLHCDGLKCVWTVLDQDFDGIPGPSCGGTDCHDGDPLIHPGAQETCDGKDNDCAGGIDNGAICPGLLACTNGQCACPQQNTCGSECVDKTANANHCGACFNACPWGASCVSGTCKCGGNQTVCAGQCVDLTSNPAHCGGCNAQCGSGQTCVAAKCTCPNNQPLCNGQCPNYLSDPNNCGGCGLVCTGGKTCQSGVCACASPQQLCSGLCVNTATDPANCGACGKKCAANQPCVGGVCQACTLGDLFFLVDHSGSMSTALGSLTRWSATQGGTKAFLAEPASASVAMGLQFMPQAAGPVPCTSNAECQAGGDFFATCVNNVCQFVLTPNPDSCASADYAKPVVPLASLSQSGQLTALNTAIDGQIAEGGTPMTPALQGALEYAKSRAQVTGHRTAVVLVTDGIPNTCTGQDTTAAAVAVAQSFSGGSPKIPTYVVAIGTVGGQDWAPTDWNQIAVAGGTGAFLPATSQAELQQQLAAIRSSFSACQ